MLREERHAKILKLLYEKKRVKLTELTTLFNVSMETIRRDVQHLTDEGKVKKVYGGIQYIPLVEQMIEERQSTLLQEKVAIGKRCAMHVNDGDTIFIDSGTTTLQMVPFLKNKKNITVLTHSIPVILKLLPLQIETIVLGGILRHSEQSIVSNEYLFQFDYLNITKAFLCASGISIENGVSDFNIEEISVRKKIMHIAKETYLAADHTKFDRDVSFSLCSVDEISHYITNDYIPKDIVQTFKEKNISLETVKIDND